MVKTMYVVESTFEHCGLTCVVVMRPNFYRCGYVGVPKESSLFGKRTNDHLEINKADIGDHHVSGTFPLFLTALDSDPRIRLDAYFHCHGGITYSDGGDGSDYPIKSDLWWFGLTVDTPETRKTMKPQSGCLLTIRKHCVTLSGARNLTESIQLKATWSELRNTSNLNAERFPKSLQHSRKEKITDEYYRKTAG